MTAYGQRKVCADIENYMLSMSINEWKRPHHQKHTLYISCFALYLTKLNFEAEDCDTKKKKRRVGVFKKDKYKYIQASE